jgi:hypothetical protein
MNQPILPMAYNFDLPTLFFLALDLLLPMTLMQLLQPTKFLSTLLQPTNFCNPQEMLQPLKEVAKSSKQKDLGKNLKCLR